MVNDVNGYYDDFRIVGIVDYGTCIEICRERVGLGTVPVSGGERSGITEFSAKARLNMLSKLCMYNVRWESMLTLTCGADYTSNGARFKQTLNRFLVAYRRSFPQPYFWFLEFQRRDAPHVHVLTVVKNPSTGHRSRVSKIWTAALGLDMGSPYYTYSRLSDRRIIHIGWAVYQINSRPRHWEVIRNRDGALRYAAKYAAKTRQKIVPQRYSNVGRFWGASRNIPIRKPVRAVWGGYSSELEERARDWSKRDLSLEYLPKWLYVDNTETG